MMNEIRYNSIGQDYNRNRAADPRIVDRVTTLLNLPAGSMIADIGAGTGNYSNALADLGYFVKAVEPSEAMRLQAPPTPKVEWMPGVSESIPLPDESVDGVIVILALHHFSSLEKAAQEMHRICRQGPIVIFTLDPREGNVPWFETYFPDIYRQDFITFQPIDWVAGTIAMDDGWARTIDPFPLPHDLLDRNMYSAWREPEKYLDAKFRRNTSGFALAAPDVVEKGVALLEEDLRSGEWDKRFGFLREQDNFDAGFRFIRCAES